MLAITGLGLLEMGAIAISIRAIAVERKMIEGEGSVHQHLPDDHWVLNFILDFYNMENYAGTFLSAVGRFEIQNPKPSPFLYDHLSRNPTGFSRGRMSDYVK